MNDRERANKLAAAAPPLSEKELAEINRLYPAYIFRDRKAREIRTSCCGRHEVIPKRDFSAAQAAVMDAAHQGENLRDNSHYRHAAYAPPRRDPETTPCPFCGADAYVKELGRTGERKNLTARKRVAAIRWHGGALWARTYYTYKSYNGINGLTARPACSLCLVYRFRPGEAVSCVSKNRDGEFFSVRRMTEWPKKTAAPIREPFPYSVSDGMGYETIGAGDIGKSPFRYCGADMFFARHTSKMRFLAVCCMYPRQVEMFMKAGLSGVVADLIGKNKRNSAAFDWDNPHPLESFQLDKNEMRDFLSGNKNIDALIRYKRFRRRGVKCGFSDTEEAMGNSPRDKEDQVLRLLRERRIEPGLWNAYIDKETRAENAKKTRAFTGVRELAQLWIDYIDAAKTLGYDLANPLMQMPRGIRKKHDAAVKAAAPIAAARRAEKLDNESRERFDRVSKRYGFALDGYVIRAPIDAEDIVREGKALKHCVGGYADRHIRGKATILFLRREAAPYEPLVTIEMRGNNLAQIHGYNNDAKAHVGPGEKYAAILEPWLAWVRAGSRRGEDGEPVRPKRVRAANKAG